MVRKPNQVLSNCSTTMDSQVIHDMDYKLADMRRNTVVVDIRAHTSTPTFSIQPKQSIDGTVWYNLGSAIAATGLSPDLRMPVFQADRRLDLGRLGRCVLSLITPSRQ